MAVRDCKWSRFVMSLHGEKDEKGILSFINIPSLDCGVFFLGNETWERNSNDGVRTAG